MPERQGLGQEFPNVRGQRPGQAPPLIIPCEFLKQILFLLLLGLNVDKWILKRISHGCSLYWGLGGILRVAEGQWKGGSGRWGVGGDSHLNSRTTSRLGHGDLRALKPQAGEENQKANCQGKTKSILCPRSSRSGLIYLGGGLPPVGNPWAGRSSGLSSWQPGHLQQVLAPA